LTIKKPRLAPGFLISIYWPVSPAFARAHHPPFFGFDGSPTTTGSVVIGSGSGAGAGAGVST
jgi:hypothetical protein